MGLVNGHWKRRGEIDDVGEGDADDPEGVLLLNEVAG